MKILRFSVLSSQRHLITDHLMHLDIIDIDILIASLAAWAEWLLDDLSFYLFYFLKIKNKMSNFPTIFYFNFNIRQQRKILEIMQELQVQATSYYYYFLQLGDSDSCDLVTHRPVVCCMYRCIDELKDERTWKGISVHRITWSKSSGEDPKKMSFSVN